MSALCFLADAGFEVLEAEHAASAIAVLEACAHDVAVLFTDIHMPGEMNGLHLAGHTRMCWPWIGVLLCSGEAHPLAVDLPHRSRFISKPYEPHHVLRHVHEMAAA